MFGLVVCLLKASLRCKSEIVGGRDGGDGGLMRWRRFGEFCGNLNNYTPCSPRVINYICGKGFLILEPSTDKGWWGERQGKRKKKEKKKREDKIQGGPYQTFLDRFRLYARLAE